MGEERPLGLRRDELAGGEEGEGLSFHGFGGGQGGLHLGEHRWIGFLVLGEGDVEFELGRFKGAADAEPHFDAGLLRLDDTGQEGGGIDPHRREGDQVEFSRVGVPIPIDAPTWSDVDALGEQVPEAEPVLSLHDFNSAFHRQGQVR